ncbi:alpha-L-iduronidase isoform X3 [Cimex lectularius]|uniref:Glycosyl hydrolases family 39 N-terminal catalytic domain-containing protein n=1 Tax=Cimex lectularius TaxID=79782 RepID=A0A8I6SMT3_CIMLE|nr:alpha-L-iduronidase isoform X3 [Cimex lectularius]
MITSILSWVLALELSTFSAINGHDITKGKVYINLNSSAYYMGHFWHNSGLSPPNSEPDTVRNYLLSSDMKKNLMYISGLPTGAIKYERIHWLFSLVSFDVETTSFNFTLLDELMDWMKTLDLLPIFEMMGTPVNSEQFLKLNKPWKHLCYNTVKHYCERFGLNYVQKWKFEFWNEIDSKQYNVFGFSIVEYLNYIKECTVGIHKVSKSFTVMGPAGVLKPWTNYSASFLKFCHEKQTLCNLTYITYHQKGYPMYIKDGAIKYRNNLNKLYPKFAGLQMANDEADTMTGWWKATPWREDVRYASKMGRMVYLLYKSAWKADINFTSFDNSFLNQEPFTFEQRTLLARFTINHDTSHHQFFEKPSYSVMGLMQMLGDYVITARRHRINKNVTYVFTSVSKNAPSRISGIIVGTNDFDMNEDKSTAILFKFNVPETWKNEVKYAVYMISNLLPHPAKTFHDLNNPSSPSAYQRKLIRNSQARSTSYISRYSKGANKSLS